MNVLDLRPGQRVRCVNDRGWECVHAGVKQTGPACGEILTILDICELSPGDPWRTYLIFVGAYPNAGYAAPLFRPLGDEQIEALRTLCADPPLRARELAELLT